MGPDTTEVSLFLDSNEAGIKTGFGKIARYCKAIRVAREKIVRGAGGNQVATMVGRVR